MPLLPAHIQKRTRRKVGEGSVRSQCGKARVPGRPSTRPEQECVPLREVARPLRRAASRPSLSGGGARRRLVPLARPGAARLPWAAAISRRSVGTRNMAVPLKLFVPASNSNYHRTECSYHANSENIEDNLLPTFQPILESSTRVIKTYLGILSQTQQTPFQRNTFNYKLHAGRQIMYLQVFLR